MSSRIEIEITSKTDPDQHNWRALGAREPKGTIDSSLLPKSVQIGDSFRVEADFLIDGIEILRVLPKKESRKEPRSPIRDAKRIPRRDPKSHPKETK